MLALLSLPSPPLPLRLRPQTLPKARSFSHADGPASDLEDEVYRFMLKSPNPSRFPTWDDLVSSGREDLAEAIAKGGGWLAMGWDVGGRVESGKDASGSRRRMDLDLEMEAAGVEGILSRLEKERSAGLGFRSKAGTGTGTINQTFATYVTEIIPNGNRKMTKPLLLNDNHVNYEPSNAWGVDGKVEVAKNSSFQEKGQSQLHIRLQQLESKLSTTLALLRSKNGVELPESQETSEKELHELSDAWEFKQNEIIKAQEKLRSTRAKLAVLEGKMALETVEGQKALDGRNKRVRSVRNAMQMLRTVSVVWPSPATEVYLTGSFDGWTSQRVMERSSTGIFSIYLKLYPGQYEIKFIVDGVWRIDPLRPVVSIDGYENNLLVIT